jgi:hypothetical protein
MNDGGALLEERLTGIDGQNPLGYLAALGAWLALSSTTIGLNIDQPLLKWSRDGAAWRPVLLIPPGIDALDGIWRGLQGAESAYEFDAPLKDDFRRKSLSPEEASRVLFMASQDASAQAVLERIVAHSPCSAPNAKGNGLDGTAFRMVSGNIAYFRNLRKIIKEACFDDVRRALYEGWSYRETSKTSLDPQTYLENIGIDIGALGAIAEAGAERLAVEGFRLYPTFPRAFGRPGTRGFIFIAGSDPEKPRWHEYFVWPIWERAWSLATADAVLGVKYLYRNGGRDQREGQRWICAAGIVVRFASRVQMYGQGYRRLERPQDMRRVLQGKTYGPAPGALGNRRT